MVIKAVDQFPFLKGGGEMGVLCREKNWNETPLGDPSSWPQSLRTTIYTILNTKFPMFLFWGSELICFYNDASRPSLGEDGKHPSILGMPAEQAWAEIWNTIKPMFDKVMQGEATWSEDQLLPIYRNGRLEDVYWTFSYSPVIGESGKPEGILTTLQETTEKIGILKNLEESKEQLLFTIEAAELGTWDLNPQTNKFIGNHRLKQWFGLAPDEEIELPLAMKIMAEKDRDKVADAIQTALTPASGGRYEIEYAIINTKTKEEKIVLARGQALFTEKGLAYRFSGTLRDITTEKKSQQELMASEQKFRLLADSMAQFVWTGDPSGNLNYFNRSVYEYSGLSPEKVAQDGWLQIVHPDDRQRNIDMWLESIHTGRPFYLEHRFRRHDGLYRWQLSRAIPQKDEAGNIQMWVGTSTDIENQKLFAGELEKQVRERTAELELKNQELYKMNAELESFAYISSHDLQEPLRKIQVFSSLIFENEHDQLSVIARDYFSRIRNSANRMQVLIADLLSYSRLGFSQRNYIITDLSVIVSYAIAELKDDIVQKNAKLEIGPLCALPIIPYQFSQLMLNLLSNALKFSRENMQPVIHISAKIVHNECHIIFSDNGIGFESQYNEQIFEVFKRLHHKSAYEGTGIGLSIVKKIVENHDGRIIATGVPGQSARFDIFIPILF